MRRPLGRLLGRSAIFGFRKRSRDAPDERSDARADELRQRLAEARELAEERDEFEAGETTIDAAEALEDPDTRRRALHRIGRSTAERMRRDGP
jgi:hypothetical protein